MNQDGSYLRYIGVADSLSILENEIMSGKLPAQGMFRITLRRSKAAIPSVKSLEVRILDALVFLCTVFGPAVRVFNTIVTLAGRSEEVQHIAVIRMGSGAIVHLDASSRSDHSGKDAWEYASRDSLLAMDERRDNPLLQGGLDVVGIGRNAEPSLGALGLGGGLPANPEALNAARRLLNAMAQSAASGEAVCL